MEYKIWNHKSAIARGSDPKRIKITSDQVSETLPNDTMSMRELVDKHVRGHTIPGLKNYPYDSDQPGELSLPDIGMMSKTEAAELKLQLKETIQNEEQNLIETRKRISINKQQMAAAKVAAKAKQKPSQAPAEPKPDEKQL